MGDGRWGLLLTRDGWVDGRGALSLPESVAMENPVRQSRAFFAPSGASDAASQPARDGFPPTATHAHSRWHGMDSRRDPHCVADPGQLSPPLPLSTFKPWSLLAAVPWRRLQRHTAVPWTGLDGAWRNKRSAKPDPPLGPGSWLMRPRTTPLDPIHVACLGATTAHAPIPKQYFAQPSA